MEVQSTKIYDNGKTEKSSEFELALVAGERMVEPALPRSVWTGRFDFLISMTAYAVGLGNVWRFPYLCFKNGGGAFLVAYLIFWFVAAVPIFLLEVTVGQYLQRGGIEVWNICPIFKGVGMANLTITIICMCYYCIISAWAAFYMIVSLTSWPDFPWETCDHEWNTQPCVNIADRALNQSLVNASTSVEQYWQDRVLQRTSSISETGGIQTELLVINLVLWIVLYFVLWRGITKARVVVYTAATVPYCMLFALLIRGLTLPGAMNGIYVYLVPDISKFSDPVLWKDAGTQIFYSYGVGYGALMALGSHNRYNHDCYKDAIIMCGLNGGTSLLAGLVVFSILGYMASMSQREVVDVVDSGVGLAFLAYPEVAALIPMKQVWSAFLFAILAVLGMDTQICLVEGASTSVEDMFPELLRKYKRLFVGVVCASSFAVGTIFVTRAGTYWLTLVDAYGCSGIALLFIVFFEVMGIAWGFGAERVFAGMEHMLGYSPPRFWLYLWKFTAPASCLLLLIALLINHRPLTYSNGEPYADWSLVVGYLLASLSMLCIPVYALYYIGTGHGTLKERLHRGFQPTGHVLSYLPQTSNAPSNPQLNMNTHTNAQI